MNDRNTVKSRGRRNEKYTVKIKRKKERQVHSKKQED